MPYSVAPGATVDISVNLTAPSSNGHYRGNWKLRNASGILFGVGASANAIFWVDIFVNSSSTSGTTYDFVANYCSALWASGSGGLGCPGTDGNTNGFVLNVGSPQLETGSSSSTPGLIVSPQQVAGGYIKGFYPAYTVQSGDHFQSIINCAYGATGCYVNFRLNYQIGGGAIQTFWTFNERYDGLYYPVNLDLSSLAGQSVNFILYMADVSGYGNPSGDRAEWVGARITGAGGGPVPPIPPSSTCDKGAFVSDVTIPDGTVMAPGSAFTKTWRIRNVGSCTWTTDYALVFAFGNQMGAVSPTNLPSGVAPVVPGATADFSVNMVAPVTPGHYRSYWRFRNASGVQFGVGSGMITFFADIYVNTSGATTSTTVITADTPDPSIPGQAVTVSANVSGSGATPTGTVSITGADSNCTISLSGGSGSCNVIFNSAGAKTLSGVYSGNGSYSGSSDTESHTVNSVSPTATTTTITADTPDPSTPGQPVTVSASVSGSGVTPTGTVAITGADSNCTITLSGGTGNCNVIFNATGAKTITGTYSGDSNYTGSSDTESHTVSSAKAASATTITADTPDPSIPGQAVVVNVTVNGAGAPTPTGTVDITGAHTNCSILLAGGSGSCSVVFNTTGAKTLMAVYSGDAVYSTSSGTASHTVIKASTTTTIVSDDPDPSLPGQSVVVSVSVLGAGATPSGTVSITGADINCTITLSGGSGSCGGVVFNTIGDKTLTATYNGDGNYLVSTDDESHTVKNATTTSITVDNPDPSVPGQAITVTVTVTGPGVTPTGTVDITGADVNCSFALGGGTGSCGIVQFNTAGAKVLTATYNGDANYVGSTSTATHTVNKGASITTITVDNPDASAPNAAVLVTVTVTGAVITPTGTVGITISGVPSSCTITLSGGTGSCSVVITAAGSYTITAIYSGDGNYLDSSDTEPHTVS